MILINIRKTLVLLMLMLMAISTAYAKDDVLVQRMIDLERVYIPALFLTSQDAPDAIPAMTTFVNAWDEFRDDYWTYRASKRNWISYIDQVNYHVDEAIELVDGGDLLEAHEVLELVRTTMRDLRRRNGFPKFVTDELTAFHSIMGTIIGVSLGDFDDSTVSTLSELYEDASKAWSKVEKNTLDQVAWGLSGAAMMSYNGLIGFERIMLDKLEMALAGGDIEAIRLAALGLKGPQAKAYLLLGGITL